MSVLGRGHAIEQGSSRTGRWLAERRIRIAAWIAVIEGLLIIVHVFGRWPAIIVALGLVVLHIGVGRTAKSHAARQVSWIIAASQALVLLVPVLWWITKAVAIVVVAIIAVVALIVLFTERRS